MTSQLSINDLGDDELRQQFNHLMEAMKDIVVANPEREEGAYEALNQRIHQAVTEKPILASIVDEEGGESLLYAASSYLNLDTSHHMIKCLIQAYPRALITSSENGTPLYMITHHPEHCVLLPWIVTNYPWFLDHDRCPRVVFALLGMYAQRQRTSCTAAILKDFFNAYPRALVATHSSMTILHYFLKILECEADLFKWMAERCPDDILLETDSNDSTPLHHACLLLARTKTRNSNDICKYLIRKCPASVPIFDNAAYDNADILPLRMLPIHFLHQDSCDYRVVREVVVCLLREYPESYDKRSYGHRIPSSIPFIQSIKPFMDEERELKQNFASLKDSISSLTEAVTRNQDEFMRSAFAVFDSWATSFINTAEDKLQQISTQLQDMCNEGLLGSDE